MVEHASTIKFSHKCEVNLENVNLKKKKKGKRGEEEGGGGERKKTEKVYRNFCIR